MKNSQVSNHIFTNQAESQKGDVLSYSSKDFYWELKIPREDIQACNQELLDGGNYNEIIKKYRLDPVYTSALQRADFIFTIPYADPKDRPLRILDLGSGYGNITMQIAKRFPDAEIYAADASLDILQFLSHRLKNESISNVTCVHIPPLEDLVLPFKKDSFDIILLNGVLEWIGAGVQSGDPKLHQKKVLSYLRELLSDDGVIYIGIESRYFISYFLGVKDPHSGLRFTSVLPRAVANYVSKIIKKRPYRTYIYSHGGYKELFKLSGFNKENIRSAFIWASYKDPFSIIPTSPRKYLKKILVKYGRRIFPTWRSALLYKTFCVLNLELFFAPSYLFYIPKHKLSKDHKNLAERYFEKATGETPKEIIKLSGSTRDDGSLYFLVDEKWNLKVPRTVTENKIEVVKEYRSTEYMGSLSYVYKYIDGEQLNKSDIFNKEVFDLIKEFHHSSLLRHGDFTYENIIRSKDGSLHLIDFDDAVNEPKIYDICDYFIQIARILYKYTPEESARFLMSEKVMQYIVFYDQNISVSLWKEALLAYSDQKIKSSKNRRQYGDYLNTLSILLRSESVH